MANRFWVGGTGTWDASTTTHWAATTGGAGGASVPNTGDDVFFNASSGGGVVSVANNMFAHTLNTTGFAGTIRDVTGFTQISVSGSFISSTAMTWGSGVNTMLFAMNASTSGNTIDLGGNTSIKTNVFQFFFNNAAGGGVYTLASDFDHGGQNDSLGNCTFATGGFNVTMGQWQDSGATGTTTITGSSVFSLSGALDLSSGSTITLASTATLRITGSSNFNATTNTLAGTVSLRGNNFVFGGATIGTLSLDKGTAQTITFQASTTTTITTAFNAVGSAGNIITINSNSGGTPATLSKASGTVNADYVSLQDSTATGGATWNAGGHSVNVSGNSGWIFAGSLPPRVIQSPAVPRAAASY